MDRDGTYNKGKSRFYQKITKLKILEFYMIPEKINKMPEFYMIFVRKINKIAEFYMMPEKINKMPEFYDICPKN